MITGGIKNNRYRVHSIFTLLGEMQDKEDTLFILKQLVTEELEQMDLPTIALVIKDTKVGQGLMFLLQKITTDLEQQLQIWLKDLIETGHQETRKQVAAELKELLKCNGNIKKENNIMSNEL